MLSVQDCIAFGQLNTDQIDAICCHQGLSPILAAEWAETILDQPNGAIVIDAVLAAAVVHAKSSGRHQCAARFEAGLIAFRLTRQ